MSAHPSDNAKRVLLSYLDLPDNYAPSPDADPIEFLTRHLRQLPPHLLSYFSMTTTSKQRSVIPAIRNRRLRYAETNPAELNFSSAKSTWPALWPGRERPGQHEGTEEREWVEKEFLGSLKPHVGKLGMLLAGYEEERESHRVRQLRREHAEFLESLPEEEDESEDEDEQTPPVEAEAEDNSGDAQEWFLRSVRERFIYGLLESIDYDGVDWDDKWDVGYDREAEERWFDDEEES
ncbi:hypothetical protein B0H21DRAFT_188737 [Amylocystis lapponica]|nr:hypothetical protein B0H21DRAFT_188737 [Amylocystis lapponica]